MQLKALVLTAVCAASVFDATVCFALTAPVLARTSGKQLFRVRPGKDIDEPNICGIPGGASFWFAYTPAKNGTLFLDTEGSDFDTLLGVFSDDGSNEGFASLHNMACDDDSGNDGITSSLRVELTNGVPCYVMLDGKNGVYGKAVLNYFFDSAPAISFIPNQAIYEDQRTAAIHFVVNDLETAPNSLQLFAECADTNLVSNSAIVFGGAGTNRTVTVTPTPFTFGTNTITIWVCDGVGNVSSTSFLLSVAKVNHKPVARDDKFTRSPGHSISIALAALTRNDSDPDGDIPVVISVSPRSSRGNSIVTKSAAFVTYTPPINYNAEDKFTYTISDGKGGTSVATVTISVSTVAGHAIVY